MGSCGPSVALFKSKRLIYRAVENTEEDKNFLQNGIFNDHACQMMGTSRLRRPAHAGSAEEAVKSFQSCLLGVFICLRPEESPKPADPESADTSLSNKPAQTSKPTPIGFLSLFNHQTGQEWAHHRNSLMAISLTDGYRGQGYGGEAINWALDWAFQQAGLHRVSLTAFAFNHNALHLYKKLGFVEEGREREAIYHFREWHDVVIFGMLEHEWEKSRGYVPGQAAGTPSSTSDL